MGQDKVVVKELFWDDWNRGHIRKHQVEPWEVEEVILGNPTVRETYKDRLQLIGPTATGRMLSVIVGPTPSDPGVFYTFSARPASRKERRRYAESRGDTPR